MVSKSGAPGLIGISRASDDGAEQHGSRPSIRVRGEVKVDVPLPGIGGEDLLRGQHDSRGREKDRQNHKGCEEPAQSRHVSQPPENPNRLNVHYALDQAHICPISRHYKQGHVYRQSSERMILPDSCQGAWIRAWRPAQFGFPAMTNWCWIMTDRERINRKLHGGLERGLVVCREAGWALHLMFLR